MAECTNFDGYSSALSTVENAATNGP